MKKKKKIKFKHVVPVILLLLIAVICLYPLLLVAFNAFSSEAYIVEHGYVYYPTSFSLEAFKMLIKVPGRLVSGLVVSLIDSVGGNVLTLLCHSLAAYALLDNRFILKKPIEYFLLFAMYCPGGGAIASYIINSELLHMQNNILVYLLPGIASVFGVFLFRTAYRQIPAALIESAQIDGATPFQIWRQIMLPLSKAFLMTQFFLNFTSSWRNMTTSLYYMTDPKLQNLEYYVQAIIKDIKTLKDAMLLTGVDVSAFPVETMQFAVVLFTIVPVLLVMPFVQRHFLKGAVVGAVKG